jgi:hypothetical protein
VQTGAVWPVGTRVGLALGVRGVSVVAA